MRDNVNRVLLVLVLVATLVLSSCATPAATPTAAPKPVGQPGPTTAAPAAPQTAAPAAKPAAEVPGVTADKVKIGYLGDMSGPTASVQLPLYRAYETYVKMLNEEGGIAGRKIELIGEDDKYTVPGSQAGYKKLTAQDNVFAIIGINGSDEITAMLPTTEKDGMIVFGTMNTVKFQIEPFRQWHFTHLASYRDMAYVLADYAVSEMKKKGEQPRVALVPNDQTSGKEFVTDAATQLGRNGVQPVAQVVVPIALTDATAQVQELKAAKPNFMIMGPAVIGQMTAFLKSMEKGSFKVPIGTNNGPLSDAVFKSVNAEYGALLAGANSFMPPDSAGPALDKMREMAQKYGNQQYLMNANFAQGWAGATTFFEALKRAGKDLTRESMRTALESLKSFDNGISAPVTYAADRHHGIDGVRLFKYDYDKQRFMAATDWLFPSK